MGCQVPSRVIRVSVLERGATEIGIDYNRGFIQKVNILRKMEARFLTVGKRNYKYKNGAT